MSNDNATVKARPSHNHIDLPRGFYAMLCHPSGAPEAEWDRMVRLVGAAPAMRAELDAIDIALTNMLQVYGESALSEHARVKIRLTRDKVRSFLARLDGDV